METNEQEAEKYLPLKDEKKIKLENKTIKKALGYLSERIKTPDIYLREPEAVFSYLTMQIGEKEIEFFGMLLLNQSNGVIDDIIIEEGIENRAQVYIKKVVRLILTSPATGVIFYHNHPSGSTIFSSSDKKLTEALNQALTAIEIRLIDHIVIAGTNHASMNSEGLL